MPVYDYEAKESQKSCPYCKDGFEIVQFMKDKRLDKCPKCGNSIIKLITAPAIGRSKSKLDDRAKNAGFTKLKKVSKGEYEKMY
ncbi:MAG: zinc ribbon domain-containing protein [Kiritimatiellae bacterium]|jgi:putative FmdB family regulatory protein|nr:zinc ribbon domain-containing protein [Kiritimatiellia bacterium]